MKHFLAIDPGDVHQGVAYFTTARNRGLIRHWTRDLTRAQLLGLAEGADVDGWVVEEFRLYPELAREQGFSNFPTCEVIGVLQYLADTRGLVMVRQGGGMKKKARQIGERVSPERGSVRRIGTARGSVWGWDFNAPSQHERDATAHGVWYAFRGGASELLERDYTKNGKLGLLWD